MPELVHFARDENFFLFHHRDPDLVTVSVWKNAASVRMIHIDSADSGFGKERQSVPASTFVMASLLARPTACRRATDSSLAADGANIGFHQISRAKSVGFDDHLDTTIQ
ncbi:MAG: hypothetical protein IID61_04285 [SAR324 cluster bacterium]|nr:hypothetical protein [SAR324 cluster bacterium]